MYYDENMPLVAAKPVLKERRVKLTEQQCQELDALEAEISVPFNVLVRMAVHAFLPRTKNHQFTKPGIKTGYLHGRY